MNNKVQSGGDVSTGNWVSRRVNTIQWLLNDWFFTHGRKYAAGLRLIQAIISRMIDPVAGLKYLMEAHRYYQSSIADRVVHRLIPHAEAEILSLLPVAAADTPGIVLASRRTLVVKNPVQRGGQIEKGALLIKFTETFPFFLQNIDCQSLLKFYYIILEPSWAGFCLPEILSWMQFRSFPVIVEATEKTDYFFIEQLQSNLLPVDFGASDWVDFRLFVPPVDAQKEFDAVYVANNSPGKRHHLFFKAIREIADPTYRAALVVANWGGEFKPIKSLMDYYGVTKQIEVFRNIPQSEVNKVLQRSKVNLLLSYKEGSNKSLFEGFLVNVPGIALKNNIGMNKSYVNHHTGVLIDEDGLKNALLHFRTSWEEYRPRDWAMENISPLKTTEKLKRLLQQLALKAGDPWTEDIVPHVNIPEKQYFDLSDIDRFPAGSKVIEIFLKQNQPGNRLPEEIISALSTGGIN